MTIIFAILALSVIVFFHEFGHFLSAKISGVKVEEFGFGYPPRVGGFSFVEHKDRKGKKIIFYRGKNVPADSKNTLYSLNYIPFGGFNRLKGELDDNDSQDSFNNQAWYKKSLISFAGAFMNICLAFLIFTSCFLIGLPRSMEEPIDGHLVKKIGLQILAIEPNSPAEKSGLKMGDLIIAVNRQNIDSRESLQEKIRLNQQDTVQLQIKRGGQNLEKTVDLKPLNQVFADTSSLSYKAVGIVSAQVGLVRYPFFSSIKQGFATVISLSQQFFQGLWLLARSVFIGQKLPFQLVGPVGLTGLMNDAARVGFVYFLQLAAILSLGLGITQLIPFPALDGFRILTSFIEGIFKNPIKPKIEALIINCGFLALLLLMLVITSKEIIKLF